MPNSYIISIDTGGTFTDCIATDLTGRLFRRKVLSNSTLRGNIIDWKDANTLQINTDWQLSRDVLMGYSFRLLGNELEAKLIKIASFQVAAKLLILEAELPHYFLGQSLSFELTAHEEAPILAARLITETALHEPFPPLKMKLGSTKGTNALLEHKGSPTLFFVTKGFKDLLKIGNQTRPDIFALKVQKNEPLHTEVIEVDEDSPQVLPFEWLEKQSNPKDKRQDIAVAICLKNAYKNPLHEQQLAEYLRKHYQYVSVSTELSAQIKFLNRAETTVVNAYLSPIIDNYLSNIAAKLPPNSLQVMTSAGNLVSVANFQPKDSLFSGPAGGVVGASVIGKQLGIEQLITFDMGGTSTDVARYDGDFDFQFEQRIGNAHIFSPSLAIETVAAGGGSICYYDGFKLCVGPQSAGANPGPACYGAGGPLTITDVNLLLGRLDSQQFGIPIFPEKAKERLQELLSQIALKTGLPPSSEQTLLGFVQIANEKMAEAVRKISITKGYNPANYALVSFGGAGGLHACGIANLLSIQKILLPKDAGLLSAFGISEAPVERFAERNILKVVEPALEENLNQFFKEIESEAIQKVQQESISVENIFIRKRLIFLRLSGQDSSLEIPFQNLNNALEAYKTKYITIYGYWNENRVIEVESIRVIAAERQNEKSRLVGLPLPFKATPTHHISAFVEDRWQQIPVYNRDEMTTGATVTGFALLLDQFSTAVVEQGWTFRVGVNGTGVFERQILEKQIISQSKETELELFMNRFSSLAENMGVMLQRTSLSVNVKERLDFSCALVDAHGELIANAPHIPVHLGSLGVCVRSLIKAIPMEVGDVVITNHPGFGGSHLPDVTLVTKVGVSPTSLSESSEVSDREVGVTIGYVVSRCHHAEIGGIRPASMPPDAKNLAEEGVVIPPMFLVKNGEVRWEDIRDLLSNSAYPSRSVEENLADLNAALAANRNGEHALQALVAAEGLEKVHYFMELLKDYSAKKMSERLRQIPTGIYEAEERLDDGTLLKVKVNLTDKLIIDFTGSSGVHWGNLNGNEAIVQSVVVYVLRTLLNEKIPLNDGILKPVQLIIPENSILKPYFSTNPAECPAVVGGNVELSQRLTDTLLKAFGVVACSQGTMNNTLFGNEKFGYYETICGGCGAGNGFHGATAVHHHMTNTRITDPEIMELRYPVKLKRFEIRENSGGEGRWRGGDGIVREIEFLAPVTLSLLSQHRIIAPYGLQGGQAGKTGNQYIIRKDGDIQPLHGIDGALLLAGDRLVIETPGGGGFGEALLQE